MKVAKIRKKNNEVRVIEEEQYSLKNIIKILIWLTLIFGTFYLITVFLLNNKEKVSDSTPTVIDSSKITMSQILSRPEDEYYVIAIKPSIYESSYIKTDYTQFYSDYITKYLKNDDSLKFYYINLDNALNKKYFGENINITDNLSTLEINDEVLFKIKKGSIEKYYVGKDNILDKLSRI